MCARNNGGRTLAKECDWPELVKRIIDYQDEDIRKRLGVARYRSGTNQYVIIELETGYEMKARISSRSIAEIIFEDGKVHESETWVDCDTEYWCNDFEIKIPPDIEISDYR